MPELIIKYNDNRTLEVLTDLSKYFDFEISRSSDIDKSALSVKQISFIPGDKTMNPNELTTIFTGKNIDSKNLRKQAWSRS